MRPFRDGTPSPPTGGGQLARLSLEIGAGVGGFADPLAVDIRVDPEYAVLRARGPPKAQRNFTEPDSRIMPGPGKTWVQAYKVHIAVDSAYQVIVHTAVTAQTVDAPT